LIHLSQSVLVNVTGLLRLSESLLGGAVAIAPTFGCDLVLYLPTARLCGNAQFGDPSVEALNGFVSPD